MIGEWLSPRRNGFHFKASGSILGHGRLRDSKAFANTSFRIPFVLSTFLEDWTVRFLSKWKEFGNSLTIASEDGYLSSEREAEISEVGNTYQIRFCYYLRCRFPTRKGLCLSQE